MSSTVRAFIAAKVDCTPAMRDILRVLGTMGKAVRPTSSDSLHITLKFFGDIRWEQTSAIARAMHESANEASALSGTLHGLGAFPSAGRPNVIWAGVDHAEALERLVADLDSKLADLGFVPEGRRFRPHVTLGRVKLRPPDALRSLLNEYRETELGGLDVDSIELFQSEPSSAGSKYTILASVPLGDQAP